ncbi:hypothetical protein LTR16_000948 [Cryomyces antarcticus]|uniref:Protein SSH4 n=1 Tax=Cryomyces antarcticus TaxID=329879 RepID=A0ABR0LQJ9_9PEZI|nr:hypothetical protein LTR16_000948 [Cryomyces antarcticus]
MTNHYPQGSPGGQPVPPYTSNPAAVQGFPRRSSYASVAAGAAASPPTFQSPTAFPYPMSTSFAPSFTHQHHSQPQSRSRNPSRGTDTDMQPMGGHGMSGSWGRGAHLPSYPSQFAHLMHGTGHPSNGDGAGDFFVPSYLKGSRYMERLEKAHKAKLAAQREARTASLSSNPGSLSTSPSSVSLHKLVGSHRGLTHDVIERAPPFTAEDGPAPLPSRWSDTDKQPGAEVQADGSEVKFTGLSKSQDEAASVRSNHPMPKECGIYYYEVTVISKGKEGLIGVGFSGPKVNLNRLPGWEPESWAYHGDDGMSFCNTASGKPYGPKYSTLDVIGCGVNFRTGCAFFTKNGVNIGIAFRDIKAQKLFPSVGLKKPGEHLRVNFGQTPFVFDIDGMVEAEKSLIHREISQVSVTSLQPPLDETALIQELIAQYLAHDGYVETGRAFSSEVREELRSLAIGSRPVSRMLDPEEDLDAVNRQRIRSAILSGDIDKALKYTSAYYPNVLRDNENIYFQLRCRKFIEMIRRCNDLQTLSAASPKTRASTKREQHTAEADEYNDVFDHQMELDDQLVHPPNSNGNGAAENNGHAAWTDDSADQMDTTLDSPPIHTESADAKYNTLLQQTLQYGQELRLEFNADPRRDVQKALRDTFALIAYTDARESSLAGMLDVKGRVPISEELNGAILVSLGREKEAALERLVHQTEVLVEDLGANGGAGAFIHVGRDFLR